MRKFIALAVGAAMIGGMTLATTSAEARPGYRYYGGHGGYGGYRAYGGPRGYGYGYGYRHRRGNAGAAIAAGVAGALIGGAIAAQQPRYYAPAPGPYYYGY